jgi:hypothetical protein
MWGVKAPFLAALRGIYEGITGTGY